MLEDSADVKYAGVGLRFVAIVVDLVVLFFIGYLIAALTGATTAEGFHLKGGPAFLFFAIGILYYWAFEAYLGGTIGKLILGMRVQSLDGEKCGGKAALIRNILRIVDGLFGYLVGAIIIWNSPKKQRLGDKVAGTVVIRRYRSR